MLFPEFPELDRRGSMNVGNSVSKSINDWECEEYDSSMLHACNAIDGTAKKVYSSLGSTARFTKLLRENYTILGPMGMPGINLVETRFPVVVDHPKAPGGEPDLADVIYGIHRCSHGHGEELPDGFQLINDASGPACQTRAIVVKGKIRLSDRIIFGLLAIAVLSPANIGQSVPDGYYLTFGDSERFIINEWWGRTTDFLTVIARYPMPLVKLDFSNWKSV